MHNGALRLFARGRAREMHRDGVIAHAKCTDGFERKRLCADKFVEFKRKPRPTTDGRIAGEVPSANSVENSTRRPGSRTGKDSRRRESNSVKIAVFAPMPSASVRTATAVNAGLCASIRSPKRMSFQKPSMANLREQC